VNLEKSGRSFGEPLSVATSSSRRDAQNTYAVIFDVDGVLIDSYEAHYQSWIALAQRTGASFDRTAFTRTFGMTSRDILRAHWPQHVIASRTVESLDDEKESLYRDIIRSAVPAIPGAQQLILALRDAGFALAVGSSGPPENVELALRGVGGSDIITVRVTGEDVTRGKPDPQVFLLASKKLGILPERCCVIEDAPAGIDAAHAAGMVCAALVSTGRSRSELAHAEKIIDHLQELTPAVIRRLIDGGRPQRSQPHV